MSKAKRDEIEEAKEGDYEFQLPHFDEKAFIRREILSARASFWTIGVGVAAGIIAAAIYYVPSISWQLGWIPVLGSVFALRPLLQRMGFPEDVTSWKALAGSFMMLFFTALGVWILGVNLL